MLGHVGIVIVTYNSAADISRLLDSIPEAVGAIDAQVVVVDNGSSDDTVAIVEARGDAVIVRSTNIGYAGGLNLGVEEFDPDLPVLVLNPDVVLLPGSVPTMLQALQRPGVGIVAPQVRSPTGGLEPSLRRLPTLPRALGLTRTRLPLLSEYCSRTADYAVGHTADWALGAVLLMSRPCYDDLGGWDETYFLYSEETDFCVRAAARGWATWYEPAAGAIHVGQGSGFNSWTHTIQILNRVRFYGRLHRRPATYAYWALALASELSWVARGQDHSRAAVVGLLRPSRRPPELNCSDRLIPG